MQLWKLLNKVNCFESTDYMVAIYSIKDANGNSVGFFGRQDSDD
jgi:hypothetical protein